MSFKLNWHVESSIQNVDTQKKILRESIPPFKTVNNCPGCITLDIASIIRNSILNLLQVFLIIFGSVIILQFTEIGPTIFRYYYCRIIVLVFDPSSENNSS